MLFGLVKLILLPLYIVKRLVWNVIWNFVYFFLRKPIRLLYIPAVIGLIAIFGVGGGGGGSDADREKNQKITSEFKSPLGPGPMNRKPITELPPIEGKIKNGNSRFAKNPVQKMDEQELLFYSREFQYAMHYTQPGTAHLWKTRNEKMFGEITAEKPFKAANNSWCRNFEELLFYKGKAQRIKGTSCQRQGEPGWCKLQPNSTHNCEIRRATGIGAYFDGMGNKIGRSFDYSIKKLNPFD